MTRETMKVIDALERATLSFFKTLRSELGQSIDLPTDVPDPSTEALDRPRRWIQAVLDKVAGMPETFRFSDVYSDEEWFSKNFPENRSITQSVAGILRELTRQGFLEQVKRGEYRRLDDPGINAVDTVVVPARSEGFERAALSQHKWWAIRLHTSMIPKIRYIAFYRVAPISAITHIAPVAEIIPDREEPDKYELRFSDEPRKIGPIGLVVGGRVPALRNIRYTTQHKLLSAKTLDELWPHEHPEAA